MTAPDPASTSVRNEPLSLEASTCQASLPSAPGTTMSSLAVVCAVVLALAAVMAVSFATPASLRWTVPTVMRPSSMALAPVALSTRST